MGVVDRVVDAADHFQRRHRATAFVVAVARSFTDCRGGAESTLVAAYGFAALFPLLLLCFTAVAVLAAGHPALQRRILESVLAEFPDLGGHLADQIHTLRANSPAVLAVTVVTVLWGGLGLGRALVDASRRAWGLGEEPADPLWRQAFHASHVLVVVAVTVLAGAGLAGLSANRVAHGFFASSVAAGGEVVLAVAVNVAAYAWALRLLAPPGTPRRAVLPGAILGGVGWAIVQAVGAALVAHHLHRAGALYGAFAVVLALVFWINLGARLFLVATHCNVVLVTGRSPRSLRRPAT